jgi:hypothetical protein
MVRLPLEFSKQQWHNRRPHANDLLIGGMRAQPSAGGMGSAFILPNFDQSEEVLLTCLAGCSFSGLTQLLAVRKFASFFDR